MADSVVIGSRLRQAREQQRRSLRSVAQAIGVSPSMLSQVETGKVQPSVSTLYALVTHLGLSIDELLDVAAPRPRSARCDAASPPPVQRAADNPTLVMQNGVRWERLAMGPDSLADALFVTYSPRASSSLNDEQMTHPGQEYGVIIDGELTLRLEDQTYVLGPGDSTHFDSSRPHLYVNHGDIPARGVWFVVGRRYPGSEFGDDATEVLGNAVDAMRALDDLSRTAR